MSRPPSSRNRGSRRPFARVNGRIRSRQVRVVGIDGAQLGVMSIGDALTRAQAHGVDLVEVVASADPPVCRIVDFGKYRYEQSKKERESKKNQHVTKLKEIKLSAVIDPHDFQVKLNHAVDFICDDMKVKISLRFRGRQMAHKDVGFKVVQDFLEALKPWAQPDTHARLVGRAINVMVSPLPKNRRAPNPNEAHRKHEAPPPSAKDQNEAEAEPGAEEASGFSNTPFDKLEGLDVKE